MKQAKMVFLFTILMSMVEMTVCAHDIQVANADGKIIYYVWTNNNTELSVSYEGMEEDSYYNEYSGNVVIPKSVTYNGTTYQVTSIGRQAFADCYGLDSVTIPRGVTSIGIGAFENSGLTSLTIPAGVTSIGAGAFWCCGSLTYLTIPESVTSIGNNAFEDCNALKSVYVKMETPPAITIDVFSNREYATLYVPYGCSGTYESTAYWQDFEYIVEMAPSSPNIVFADAAVKAICVQNWDTNDDGELSEEEAAAVTDIGELFKSNDEITTFNELRFFTGLISIGNEAFYGCSNLASIVIPKNVRTIGSSPFGFCYSLESLKVDSENNCFDSRGNSNAIIETTSNTLVVGCKKTTIPNSILRIGRSAFANVTRLQSISIPNGVIAIEPFAFLGCTGLKEISIPESITEIGECAFLNCKYITKAEFASVESLCSIAFQYSLYENGSCSSNPLFYAQSLYIDGVEVTEIVIPDGVTSISLSAFYGRKNLTSVTIPSSVETIGSYAFYGCSNLNSINIPEKVKVIGSYAFYGCSSLTNLTLPPELTNIGNYTFWASGITKIIIPKGVTSIFPYSFEGCQQLESVVIPSTVSYIGAQSFYYCYNLKRVYVYNATPISIGFNTFSNSNATLYVPVGNRSVYEEADYWKEFKEIIEFVDGDVNGDGESDVLDVVDIARYVVGTPAETFVSILADIDNSGEVNIGDAVCLVNEIAGDQNFARSMAPRHTVAEEMLTLALQDDNSLSLALQNMRDYTAFQFDLYVPEDTDIAKMMLNAQRKQKHQLLYNKVEDGHWRVAAISTSNRTFLNNSRELLSIMPADVLTDNVTISNIHFFTPDGGDYTFSELSLSSTTAIANLSFHPSSKGEGTIYDLSGRRMKVSSASMLPKGVYIIDGKKVVIK